MARYPIHPPYFVNRLRGETTDELLKSMGGVFSELHRYLRYLLDTGDKVQENILSLQTEFNISVTPIPGHSSPYTILPGDQLLLVDATLGPVTILFPAAASNTGRVLWVKKIDSTFNFVTLDGNGSETIDDATTVDLIGQHEVMTLVCDGSEWWIL